MKRLTLLTTIATLGVAAAAPALAGPGGGGGGRGGGGGLGLGAGVNAGAGATIDRGMGRGNGNALGRGMSGDILGSARSTGSARTEAVTGTRIPDSATRIRGKSEVRASTGVNSMASTRLTGVESGMTVNDSGGAAIGTVTGVTTKGNGSIRTVQVTLTNGQIVTLAPSSLTLNGDVLTTNSLTSNVKSQGVAHANINGLIHASPNSALASAGVTSLTGLATGLTVNNSGGTAIGTVDSIVTNRAGAVIAVRVALDGGGTATIPATTLSMDGTTVVTSSTQF
jgi:hypothetical protein